MARMWQNIEAVNSATLPCAINDSNIWLVLICLFARIGSKKHRGTLIFQMLVWHSCNIFILLWLHATFCHPNLISFLCKYKFTQFHSTEFYVNPLTACTRFDILPNITSRGDMCYWLMTWLPHIILWNIVIRAICADMIKTNIFHIIHMRSLLDISATRVTENLFSQPGFGRISRYQEFK